MNFSVKNEDLEIPLWKSDSLVNINGILKPSAIIHKSSKEIFTFGRKIFTRFIILAH